MTVLTPRPHPARWSENILTAFTGIAHRHLPLSCRALDPFAGVGLGPLIEATGIADFTGLELEPEWACAHPRTIVGNATMMPFKDGEFDAVFTSPVYGNRMSDKYDGRDGSKRITYRIKLGRMPSEGSSATMQFGLDYCELHNAAWREVKRVLRPGGLFVLNVSDHIRQGRRVKVSEWHGNVLEWMGFEIEDWMTVSTRRMKMGSDGSRDLRVNGEEIIVARRP